MRSLIRTLEIGYESIYELLFILFESKREIPKISSPLSVPYDQIHMAHG